MTPNSDKPGAGGRSRARSFWGTVRWLHIYLSALGFLALLFFGVTGFTLNHPQWFYDEAEDVHELQGNLDPALLNLQVSESRDAGSSAGPTLLPSPVAGEGPGVRAVPETPNAPTEAMELPPPVEAAEMPLPPDAAAPLPDATDDMPSVADSDEVPRLPPPVTQSAESYASRQDFAANIDKLAVVETLRSRHGIGGAVDNITADEYRCSVVFKAPGYSADVFIDRATGEYRLAESYRGAVAVLNDLHAGRDAGLAWSWVIDVSAVIMVIAAVTGLALLFVGKRRRRAGVLVAVLGSVLVLLVYVLCVP